jgi:GTP-binding protein
MNIVIHNAEHIASAHDVRDLPVPTLPEIAIAGRSNVGKSSLINDLLQRRKLVRTSNTPGATRGLSVFRVQLSQGSLDLVDLPGYGYAQRSKEERRTWGPMMENFLQLRAGLRAVLVLVDLRRGLGDDDAMLIEFLEMIGHKVILVATKADKLAKNARFGALASIKKDAGVAPIAYSVEEPIGRDQLWKAVLHHTGLGAPEKASPSAAED